MANIKGLTFEKQKRITERSCMVRDKNSIKLLTRGVAMAIEQDLGENGHVFEPPISMLQELAKVAFPNSDGWRNDRFTSDAATVCDPTRPPVPREIDLPSHLTGSNFQRLAS